MIRLVFIDNIFSETDSDTRDLPTNIAFLPESSKLRLEITRDTHLSTPIHFLHLQKNAATTQLTIEIILQENSELTLMDEYQGNQTTYTTNFQFKITVEKNARLYYHKIQNEAEAAHHSAIMNLQQAQDSLVNMHLFSCGAENAKTQITAKLLEKGAKCYLHGIYYLNTDNQTEEHQLHIDHLAPYSESSMIFKGILNKKSRAMFHGKVHVQKDAQYIQAKQANHHLLLSQQAEADSKPELEIYADNVKCVHGATTGQLDEEALFYLCSRGLDKPTATTLLTQAFATDVLHLIQNPQIAERMQALFAEKMVML